MIGHIHYSIEIETETWKENEGPYAVFFDIDGVALLQWVSLNTFPVVSVHERSNDGENSDLSHRALLGST